MPGLPSTAQNRIFARDLVDVFAITFFFYDHLITSGNEIDYLWRRPKTRSTYLFFFNRYFAFFGNIATMVLTFTTPIHPEFIVCGVLALRIYALYNRSTRILLFTIGCVVILVAITSWSLSGQMHTPAIVQGSGCHVGVDHKTSLRLVGAWETLFVYDTIVFSLTMWRTWKDRNEFKALNLGKNSMIYLMFRDGAIYFVVLALANLANIMTFYFGGPYTRGVLSTFSSTISTTMMSRLMLNLHEHAHAGIYSTASQPDWDTLDFS